MRVIVIGAGASGLTAAIACAKNGHEVTILEKNNKCGKKLLGTGNGHCNFWHEKIDEKNYHTENATELSTIIKKEKENILPFFDSLKIIYKNKNGYYYPMSNQAITMVNALLNTAIRLKVKILTNTEVLHIKKENTFQVLTNKQTYSADCVILATGSKASVKSANGYDLAKECHHHITPLLPALTGLIGKDSYYKEWEGVRCEVQLSWLEDGKKQKEEYGEIQCTKEGISGICVFNVSGPIAKGLQNHKEEELHINFIPWLKEEDIQKWFQNQYSEISLPIQEILDGFLNYKITNIILKKLNLDPNASWKEVPIHKLINLLTNFPFHVKEINSMEHAQVCSGGIPLTEINPLTMESKKVKGLYLTGELLDVDGDCGGYNLGFAWMSGLIAGNNIKKEK